MGMLYSRVEQEHEVAECDQADLWDIQSGREVTMCVKDLRVILEAYLSATAVYK